MLGAAHVLAMDSKNLLDVIDTIRVRYPHINQQLCNQSISVQAEGLQKAEQLEELNSGFAQNISLPTPVTCTFVQSPAYAQKIHHISSNSTANSSTNNTTSDS